MRTRLLTPFMRIERLRLLPWALAALLVVTQFWTGAHKAQLDGHEVGQYCQACVLADRDDGPPSAIPVPPEFIFAGAAASHFEPSVWTATPVHSRPPPRAPPYHFS